MSKRILCLVLAVAMLFILLVTPAMAADKTSINQKEIYRFLTEDLGLNTAAACGIMGNIYYETGYRADITVGDYYGLFMYYPPLGEALRTWCDSQKLDYRTVDGQMKFLRAMFNGEVAYFNYISLYSSLLETENTANGAYNAGAMFCRQFEKPSDLSNQARLRAEHASGVLFQKYKSSLVETSSKTASHVENEVIAGSYMAMVSTDILNVRTGPGMSYRVFTALVRGQKVRVYETASADDVNWCRIDGGWVASNYLTKVAGSDSENDSEGEDDPENTVIGNYSVNASALNVRNAAGLAAAVIDCIYRGTKVSVLDEELEDGLTWCKLSIGGWVCKDYLSEEESSGSFTASSYLVTASGLNVRTGAGTEYPIVDCFRRGTRVSVAETKKDISGLNWGKLDSGNWVCMNYLSKA